MKPAEKLVLVAGVLNLSTAPTSAIWRVLAQQLRLEFDELTEVARSPSARVELRQGVRNRSRITSLCALLDAVLRRSFRLRKYPFMGLFYRALLSQAPSVVLTLGAHPALCREAKKLGIPVVELEHAPGGGGQLNHYRERSSDEIPDHYVVFDRVAFEVATQMIGETTKIFLADSPPLNSRVKDLTCFRGEGRTVLFALQWGSYTPSGSLVRHAPGAVIPGIIREAVELEDNSTRWVIRPHPRQMYDKQYRSQMEEICDFAALHDAVSVDPLSEPLNSVIASCDVLVSAFSSSAIEAAERGIPSIFLDHQVLEYVRDLVAGKKMAALLSSEKALTCGPTGADLLKTIHSCRRFAPEDVQCPTVAMVLREITLK